MTGRILVTGGNGLLGKALTEHLRTLGADVFAPSSTDGDLRDPDVCKKIVSGIDQLFHLASFRRNVAYHLTHRKEVMEANIGMTEALAGALKSEGRAIPVTFFSTAILGTYCEISEKSGNIPEKSGAGILACQAGRYARSQDINIDDIADGYAAAKLRCEERWRETCTELQSPLLMVRPPSAYGPGDNFGPEANVIPSLIKKCMDGKDSLTVWGSGQQIRSFLYAKDVGPALMTLIDGGVTGTQYLCPPERVTIGELAGMIRDLVRPEMTIAFDTSQPEGPSFPDFPPHERLRDFSWTSLSDGLRATVKAHHMSC